MPVKHTQITDELQETASLYAAGALPENERQEYVRHLVDDDCAVCLDEVRDFQSAASLLALDSPMVAPSARVKERLMEQARASAAPYRVEKAEKMGKMGKVGKPQRQGVFQWLPWTTGAAAVAASAALVFVLNDNSHLRQLTDSLSNRVALLESQLTDQRVRLASLTSPQIRVVNLAGQASSPGAIGRIFWDQTKHRWLFVAENLPPVSADKAYQLWFVPAAGNPVSASVFNTNASGSVEIEIPVPDTVGEVKAAAVTTEPAGGLPQPSGAFALLGEVR